MVNNLALLTPMFEGDLDSYVFSGQAGKKIIKWPVQEGDYGLTARAGHLKALAVGDVLALLPTAASSVEDALGFVSVTYADTFVSDFEPVEHNGVSAPNVSEVPGAPLRGNWRDPPISR